MWSSRVVEEHKVHPCSSRAWLRGVGVGSELTSTYEALCSTRLLTRPGASLVVASSPTRRWVLCSKTIIWVRRGYSPGSVAGALQIRSLLLLLRSRNTRFVSTAISSGIALERSEGEPTVLAGVTAGPKCANSCLNAAPANGISPRTMLGTLP